MAIWTYSAAGSLVAPWHGGKTRFIIPPFQPSPPKGPVVGRAGRTYTYTTRTNDSNNDSLFYLFDWGDGSDSGWLGPYTSGETAEGSHTWVENANCSIRVKAKDDRGLESEWSDPLPISMPLQHQTLLELLIEWILQICRGILKIYFNRHENYYHLILCRLAH